MMSALKNDQAVSKQLLQLSQRQKCHQHAKHHLHQTTTLPHKCQLSPILCWNKSTNQLNYRLHWELLLGYVFC